MKYYNVVCAVIFNDKGEVFVTKRGPGRPLVGFWEFPGGKKEETENFFEATIREIEEELSIIVEPIKYLTNVYYEYPSIGDFNEFSITLHAIECRIKSGEINLNEHTDAMWTTLRECRRLDFAFADKKIVEYLINNKK